MRIAVLGPGGVGGLLAAVLHRGGSDVLVIAPEPTAQEILARGVRVSSVMFGEITAEVAAAAWLTEPADVLIVATKAGALEDALRRVEHPPGLVLPLLNGLDHLAVLRSRFGPGPVLAGAIRVEADRPAPGVVVHSSPFLLVDMATSEPASQAGMQALGRSLEQAGVPVRVRPELTAAVEADVMWSKLVRLNALACTTSAFDKLLGEIRDTPELYADLVASIEEACAVGRAEGASVEPGKAIQELLRAHATLGTSMQRDIAAGRPPELDAIPGSVLRAAARHAIECPTIGHLTAMIAARAGIAPPAGLAARAG